MVVVESLYENLKQEVAGSTLSIAASEQGSFLNGPFARHHSLILFCNGLFDGSL